MARKSRGFETTRRDAGLPGITSSPYIELRLAGGTMPLRRRYTAICP